VKPDPRPTRIRGKLPTIAELGGRCQVCGYEPGGDRCGPPFIERMHLLRGAWKEDVVELIMLGCGDYGNCRIHPRLDRECDPDAGALVRTAMTAEQEAAIVERRGRDYLDRHYPKKEALHAA
jgi:hypothetical protein